MLTLGRKENDEILVGDNITIKVVSIRGGVVRLGIEAPNEVSIVRRELKLKGKDRHGEPNDL